MTTSVKIVNDGHYPIVVNVFERSAPGTEGTNVEKHDLKPGETSPSITIYGWRRSINILEVAVAD